MADAVVVAADVGEAKDAGHFAKRLELPMAIIDKRRSGDDERAEAVARDRRHRGKRCLIVDDEIATGGSIFSATDFLLDHGALSVSAAVVHPVLSGRAIERLAASRLERLLVTNTIPLRDAPRRSKCCRSPRCSRRPSPASTTAARSARSSERCAAAGEPAHEAQAL